MPVPTSMADLSATAGSNSPSGTETAAGVVDDYLRNLSAIVRGTESYRTGVASASTINVTSYPEQVIQITGTASISSLGSGSDGQLRVLRFTDAATLVHSSVLQLPLSANIKTAAGDVAEFRYMSSAWVCVDYQTFTGSEGCVVNWASSAVQAPDYGSIGTPTTGALLGASGTISVLRSVNGAWSNGVYTAIRSGVHSYTINFQAGTAGTSGKLLIYPVVNGALVSYQRIDVTVDGWVANVAHKILLSAGQTLSFRAWSTNDPRPTMPFGTLVITNEGA